MREEEAQNRLVGVVVGGADEVLSDVAVITNDIFLMLFGEGGAGFVELMPMVQELDGLFEADGDDQTEDDGGHVNEEVAPGADCFMGWMDVDHEVLWMRRDVTVRARLRWRGGCKGP